MLRCVHLYFETANGLPVNNNIGEIIHGLWFRMIKELDEDIANRWHTSNTKPFSIHIERISPLCVQINLLTAEAVSLSNRMTTWRGKSVALDTKAAVISRVECDNPHLYAQLVTADITPFSKVSMQLLSPMSFRDHGIQMPFPQPELVFSSLYRKWNELCSHPLPETPEWHRLLLISRFKLESDMSVFRKYKLMGAVGFVSYQLAQNIPDEIRALVAALSKFANYSGVGYKTTMGLGKVQMTLE